MKMRAFYKPLKRMLKPDQIESINFETNTLGVYMEMDGKGYHKLRMSDFEIMWFTGLSDRDDEEIYEGDIVEVYEKDSKWTHRVEYSDGGYWVGDDNCLGAIHSFCEVIGSRWDNPNELEG